MVRIGIVGLGFMGLTHFRAARGLYGGEVAAVCSRSPEKRGGDLRGILGNFGEPGGRENFSDLRAYAEFDAILNDDEIDLIDICLPSELHRDATIGALRAGKHVLVEKPIAVTIEDAEHMVRVAREQRKLLLVAHVLPYFPEFAYVLQAVRKGGYGDLIGGHLKRIISRPDWRADTNGSAQDAGPGIDLHVHDTHFVHLLCGRPDSVSSSGRLRDGKRADYLATTYHYDSHPDLCLTSASGAVSQPGRAFCHGFEIYLEEATVLYEAATLEGQQQISSPLTVLTDDGKVQRPDLGSQSPGNAFQNELQAAVDSVASGIAAPELEGGRAADALRLCIAEIEAARTRSPISMDRFAVP